ncbi:trichohyalin-like [Xenia sp. Carnegie-2017]|uniref:trichohyalin-like n=1 Tax=Xenia sp. Carnegie-2017 TaxID=2897299 RepID=UPI001F033FCE|nr:trichohyalin-like [Xenia sp. Carnegie-2017]
MMENWTFIEKKAEITKTKEEMAETMEGKTKTRLTGTSIVGKEKEMIKIKEEMKEIMLSEMSSREKRVMLNKLYHAIMYSYLQEYMQYLMCKQDYIDIMLEKGEEVMSQEEIDARKQMIMKEKTFLDEEEKMFKIEKEMYEEMTTSTREPENLEKLELLNIFIDMNSFEQCLTDLELNEKKIQSEKDVSHEVRKKLKEMVKSRKYDLQGEMEVRPRRYFRLETDMDDFRHDMKNLLQEKNEGKFKSYELEKKIKQMKIDLIDEEMEISRDIYYKEMRIRDDIYYEEREFYKLNEFGLKRDLRRLEKDMICEEFNIRTLRIKHKKEDDLSTWEFRIVKEDTNVRLQKCYVDVNNVIIDIDENFKSFQPEKKVKLESKGLIEQEATIFDRDSRKKLRQEWKLSKELYDQEWRINNLESDNKEMIKEGIKEVDKTRKMHFTNVLFEGYSNLKEVELKITKSILESQLNKLKHGKDEPMSKDEQLKLQQDINEFNLIEKLRDHKKEMKHLERRSKWSPSTEKECKCRAIHEEGLAMRICQEIFQSKYRELKVTESLLQDQQFKDVRNKETEREMNELELMINQNDLKKEIKDLEVKLEKIKEQREEDMESNEEEKELQKKGYDLKKINIDIIEFWRKKTSLKAEKKETNAEDKNTLENVMKIFFTEMKLKMYMEALRSKQEEIEMKQEKDEQLSEEKMRIQQEIKELDVMILLNNLNEHIADVEMSKELMLKAEKTEDSLTSEEKMLRKIQKNKLKEMNIRMKKLIIQYEERQLLWKIEKGEMTTDHVDKLKKTCKTKLQWLEETTKADQYSMITKLRHEWNLLKKLYIQERGIANYDINQEIFIKNLNDELFEKYYGLKQIELRMTENILESQLKELKQKTDEKISKDKQSRQQQEMNEFKLLKKIRAHEKEIAKLEHIANRGGYLGKMYKYKATREEGLALRVCQEIFRLKYSKSNSSEEKEKPSLQDEELMIEGLTKTSISVSEKISEVRKQETEQEIKELDLMVKQNDLKEDMEQLEWKLEGIKQRREREQKVPDDEEKKLERNLQKKSYDVTTLNIDNLEFWREKTSLKDRQGKEGKIADENILENNTNFFLKKMKLKMYMEALRSKQEQLESKQEKDGQQSDEKTRIQQEIKELGAMILLNNLNEHIADIEMSEKSMMKREKEDFSLTSGEKMLRRKQEKELKKMNITMNKLIIRYREKQLLRITEKGEMTTDQVERLKETLTILKRKSDWFQQETIKYDEVLKGKRLQHESLKHIKTQPKSIKLKEGIKETMLSEMSSREKRVMLNKFYHAIMRSYLQEYMKYLMCKQDYIDIMLEKGEEVMSQEEIAARKQMIMKEKTFLDEEEKMFKIEKEMYEEMTTSTREPENLENSNLKKIQTEKDVSQEERKKWKEMVKSRKYDLQGEMEEQPRRYYLFVTDIHNFRHDMANLLQEKNEGKLKSYELEKKIKQMKIDLIDKEMRISDDIYYEERDFYKLNKFGLKRDLRRLEQDMICDEFNIKTLRIKHEKEDDMLIWKFWTVEEDTNVRLQQCYNDFNNVIIDIDENFKSFRPEIKVKLESEDLIEQKETIFDKDSRTKLQHDRKLLKELYHQERNISCLERANEEMMKKRIEEVKENKEMHFTDELFERNFNLKDVELKITKNILESQLNKLKHGKDEPMSKHEQLRLQQDINEFNLIEKLRDHENKTKRLERRSKLLPLTEKECKSLATHEEGLAMRICKEIFQSKYKELKLTESLLQDQQMKDVRNQKTEHEMNELELMINQNDLKKEIKDLEKKLEKIKERREGDMESNEEAKELQNIVQKKGYALKKMNIDIIEFWQKKTSLKYEKKETTTEDENMLENVMKIFFTEMKLKMYMEALRSKQEEMEIKQEKDEQQSEEKMRIQQEIKELDVMILLNNLNKHTADVEISEELMLKQENTEDSLTSEEKMLRKIQKNKLKEMNIRMKKLIIQYEERQLLWKIEKGEMTTDHVDKLKKTLSTCKTKLQWLEETTKADQYSMITKLQHEWNLLKKLYIQERGSTKYDVNQKTKTINLINLNEDIFEKYYGLKETELRMTENILESQLKELKQKTDEKMSKDKQSRQQEEMNEFKLLKKFRAHEKQIAGFEHKVNWRGKEYKYKATREEGLALRVCQEIFRLKYSKSNSSEEKTIITREFKEIWNNEWKLEGIKQKREREQKVPDDEEKKLERNLQKKSYDVTILNIDNLEFWREKTSLKDGKGKEGKIADENMLENNTNFFLKKMKLKMYMEALRSKQEQLESKQEQLESKQEKDGQQSDEKTRIQQEIKELDVMILLNNLNEHIADVEMSEKLMLKREKEDFSLTSGEKMLRKEQEKELKKLNIKMNKLIIQHREKQLLQIIEKGETTTHQVERLKETLTILKRKFDWFEQETMKYDEDSRRKILRKETLTILKRKFDWLEQQPMNNDEDSRRKKSRQEPTESKPQSATTARQMSELGEKDEVSSQVIIVTGGSYVEQDPENPESLARSSNSVEMYNPNINSWAELPSMNIGRAFHSSVVLDNTIYVSGGDVGNDYTDTIEYLNVNDIPLIWRISKATLPCKLSGHQTLIYNRNLVVIGGQDGSIQATNQIYEVSLSPPYTGRPLCTMPNPR